MIKTVKSLFVPDAVYVSKAEGSKEVLREVYGELRERGYVKDDFLTEILKREAAYPTGIDTTPISPDLPNVAIPHTEGEFVNVRLVVPVSLQHEVTFKNMINPAEDLQVKFLFMILNNDPAGQANILAQIMDFLRLTPVDQLQQLFNSQSPDAIYQFMIKNFKEK